MVTFAVCRGRDVDPLTVLVVPVQELQLLFLFFHSQLHFSSFFFGGSHVLLTITPLDLELVLTLDHKLIHAISLQRFRLKMFTRRSIVACKHLPTLFLKLVEFGKAGVPRRHCTIHQIRRCQLIVLVHGSFDGG